MSSTDLQKTDSIEQSEEKEQTKQPVVTDINSKAKSLVPEDDEYSIHERIERIFKETEVDRKSQIQKRIQYGDAFTQTALSIAFWGFWIFWLIVFLC